MLVFTIFPLNCMYKQEQVIISYYVNSLGVLELPIRKPSVPMLVTYAAMYTVYTVCRSRSNLSIIVTCFATTLLS